MRRLSTTTIGMMAWSKRVCVLLVVSLLFDLSVCLCRPECLSVTGLRFTVLTVVQHSRAAYFCAATRRRRHTARGVFQSAAQARSKVIWRM